MKLNQYDLERALKILPEEVKALLILHGKDLVVAGGFIRSVVLREPIKDIDLFSTSPENARSYFNELEKKMALITSKWPETYTTDNAYSLKNVRGKFVQFIHRWCYPDPLSLINSFDFTIARAAIWFNKETNKWDSVADPEFYQDCAAKRLNFKNPTRAEEPAGSLLRVIKFVRKGYTIPSRSLAGVVAKATKKYNPSGNLTTLDIEADFGTIDYIAYQNISRITGES